MALYIDEEILIRQKRLGMTFYAVWMMVITTIQWMSLDIYIPALPVLKTEFGVSEAMLNLSLNSGVVTAAIGTLIGGTISDRFGRKSMLISGLCLVAAGMIACAFAGSVELIIVMRGISGIGCGFALSITLAVIKDSYKGESFRNIMTVLQSVAVVGPIIAPVLGALLINLTSWRMIFVFTAVSSLITALPLIISTETFPKEKRFAGGFRQVIQESGKMVRDLRFLVLVGVMAFLTIPVWAYISVSSYVYIEEFDLNNLIFSAFYAVASGMSFIAPFLYIFIYRRSGMNRTVNIALAMVLAGALLLLTTGRINPFLFLLGILPLMLSEGIIRPLVSVVIMEEHADMAGTASSLLQFVGNIVGTVGTTLATLNWTSQIIGVGIISLACGAAGIGCWSIFCFKGRKTNN